MRRFEDSKKYWAIEVQGAEVVTRSGPIGEDVWPDRKRYPDAAAAHEAAERQIAQRLERGFVEVSSTRVSPPADPDPPDGDRDREAVTVRLLELGDRKISVIKVIREHTGLGLADSKDLAESAPTVVARRLDATQGQALVHALRESGARAALEGGPSDRSAEPAVRDGAPTTLVLTDAGRKKIAVIKVIREITDLGLKEAKELADTPPSVIKADIPQSTAETLATRLEAEGASTQISGGDPRPRDAGVTLVLTRTGPNKIEVIKLVRYASGVGLKQAKDISEATPATIKAGMSREEAESFAERIRKAGGDARIE